jgi:hypothetical protein
LVACLCLFEDALLVGSVGSEADVVLPEFEKAGLGGTTHGGVDGVAVGLGHGGSLLDDDGNAGEEQEEEQASASGDVFHGLLLGDGGLDEAGQSGQHGHEGCELLLGGRLAVEVLVHSVLQTHEVGLG